MLKEKQTNIVVNSKKKGRIIAKCSEIHQNVLCPKFNVKKVRDIL